MCISKLYIVDAYTCTYLYTIQERAQAAVQAGEELKTRLEQAEMATEKEREEKESLSKALRTTNNTGKKLDEVNTN